MTLSSMGLDAEETPTVKKLHKRSFAAYDNPEWSADSEEENEKEDTDIFKFTRPLSSEEPHTTKWKKISAAPDTQYDCWTCREPPCREVRFMDWSSYEAHLEWHKLACFECYLHFPTEQMLNLHLEEEHNPFVKAPHGRRKGSPKHKCFIEGCTERFRNFKDRNYHLMSTHYFPANYYFGVIKYGIDNRDSMLTRTTFEESMKTSKADKLRERKSQEKTERKNRRIAKIHDDMEMETVRQNGSPDDEMKSGAPSVDINEDVKMAEIIGDVTNKGKTNSLPFYGFQKYGIGI